MKRFWGHIWAASITAGIGGVLLPACAHDDSTLYIAQVVVPPIATLQGCLYIAPSPLTPGLFSGLIDVGVASSYGPAVLVGNQLTARDNQVLDRTETNRVQLRGAVVRVTDSQGNQISTFTSLTDGTIDPQVGTTPGYGVAAVVIIDPTTADSIRAQLPNRAARKSLVSYFKVFGQTTGGTYVESNEFQYPIAACNGCLVSFPAEAEDPNLPVPNCGAPLATAAGAAGGGGAAIPCVIGQDQPVDCRLCQGLDACNPAKLR